MEHKMKAWEVFIGQWYTTGQTTQNPPLLVSGMDTYEWFPGNSFVVHKIDVKMGEDAVIGLEMIGYDEKTQQYTMQFYDNHGNTSHSTATVNGRNWTFLNGAERGLFTISENGREICGTWERSEDGGKTWEHWMDITLSK